MIPVWDGEQILEGKFNLWYGSQGGMTWGDLNKMKYKHFLWNIERLTKQKKMENDQIKQNSNTAGTLPTSDKRKYLGR